VDDECVDPCEGVECESWEECQQGVCVDQSCTAIGNECPSGEFCVDHECVADPCVDAECDPETEYCVRECEGSGCTHRCEALCACPPGERCDADANCVQDLCADVECTGTEKCDPATGECVTDPCFNVTCDPGQTCYEGDCIDDPCDNVDCPPFYECEVIDSDDVTATPQCQIDQSYWDPGTEGSEVLGTGGGGCGCRSTDSSSTRLPLFLLLLLMLVGATRRRAVVQRRSGRKGGQR
jgi:MYXO-CTERM domain-containing protein